MPFHQFSLRLLPFVLAAGLHSHAAHATEDVPFVAAPDHVTLAMLRIADVGPRDYLIDLGSGDGRIVITAAKRFGASALGVEIVPDLVRQSTEYARTAGVSKRAEFREQDIFKTDLSPATVITMHLLPAVNLQLRPSLLALKPGTRIVSHDGNMGEWRPDRVLTVAVSDKALSRGKVGRVYLWTVPARVEGTWCGSGKFKEARLQIRQTFQDVQGSLFHQGALHAFSGSLQGASLNTGKNDSGRATFELDGGNLMLERGRGKFKPLQGARFVPATDGICK